MAGKFPSNQVQELLVACHRRCCICHRFCGVKMELDHLVPGFDGGTDSIDNAIPVCFECHAEIHSYNDKHPRGRKFQPEELRAHKAQWLETCRTQPEALMKVHRDADVGPLQALIDELEYNATIARRSSDEELGALFADDQFRRAVQQGAISILVDEIRTAILEIYALMNHANQKIAAWTAPRQMHTQFQYPFASDVIKMVDGQIHSVRSTLLNFLKAA